MKLINNFIFGLFILYIQILFSHNLAIFGVSPCFLISYLITISLRLDYNKAISTGFLIALLNDLMYPQLLGLGTISAAIIVFLVHSYQNSINKEKPSIVFISIGLLNLIHLIFFFLYKIMIYEVNDRLVLSSLIFLIYNTVLSTILVYIFYLTSKIKVSINA